MQTGCGFIFIYNCEEKNRTIIEMIKNKEIIKKILLMYRGFMVAGLKFVINVDYHYFGA